MSQLLRREFTIELPVEKAWRHLARVEQWPSWAKHIKQVQVQRPAAPQGELQPVRLASPSVCPPESVIPNYASIDDVPDGVLHEVILNTLRSCGATGVEDLTRTVARQIGFNRTGHLIQEEIEVVIDQLVSSGRLGRTQDGRIQIGRNVG